MTEPLTLAVGDTTIIRLEESYEPSFPVDVMLPSWSPGIRDEHGPETIAQFVDPASNLTKVSVHTWVVRTPQSVVLVDTCNGNHKNRNLELGNQLETDWLDRFRALGIDPGDVTAVVCTHIHLDHVGWNTSLVDGEWVPTFPNATYYFNKTEFEFWRTDTPGLEFNANVFEDSVKPVFDRDLVELWEGDGATVDDTFTLALAAGHTPGHNIAWLESKGERALFSGDSMHSGVQVYEPSWSSGFCIDPETAVTCRRSLLEQAVERNALLLPAHFSAPHAFRVTTRGDGFALVDAA